MTRPSRSRISVLEAVPLHAVDASIPFFANLASARRSKILGTENSHPMLICINSGRIPLGEVLTVAALSTIADKSILIRRVGGFFAEVGRLGEQTRCRMKQKRQ